MMPKKMLRKCGFGHTSLLNSIWITNQKAMIWMNSMLTVFLESLGETKTVKQMREEIKESDLDFNKRMALVEYCLWKYKKSVSDFVKVPIGSDSEVAKAEAKLKQVQEAFQESNQRAAEAKEAYREAKESERIAKQRKQEAVESHAEAVKRDETAKAREAEAISRETELKEAQAELEEALAVLKAQEDAYNNKTADLKKKSETGGIVSRNRAKNELEQHLGQDPLPLRRAKITQEAAVKKANKATEAAKAAREEAEEAASAAATARTKAAADKAAAEAAATQAESDRIASEAANEAAAKALAEARQQLDEAVAYLQEVKARLPKGTAWWIDRSLEEQKKYLPQRKGGVAK
eukprot:TRINITY_DN7987_c0_g1_i2.p1 TRINITY_DN7987_c0_g1~~TRINITY_DN7987_c0_g1_i2.p1  ORF type:complete len:350 (-),score=124.90 TRINITY_DN7987_c0_g1_i2:26-1075(-)